MAIVQKPAMSAGALVNTSELIPSGIMRYTVVNVADDSTTVSATPAILYSVHVNTALSAHACPIADNTTTVFSLAASSAVGTNISWPKGIPFNTSLIVDPDNSGTGSITLVWAPQ
jgi:hypothetical protein